MQYLESDEAAEHDHAYHYTVTELDGEKDGIVYDTIPREITVRLSDDDGDGKITVTVKVGDITISRGKRVSIVDPTAQTEEEKEEAAKPAEKPADETADDADASKEEASDASKEEAAQPTNPSEMTEEEMAQQAMEEGNFDPAASSF